MEQKKYNIPSFFMPYDTKSYLGCFQSFFYVAFISEKFKIALSLSSQHHRKRFPASHLLSPVANNRQMCLAKGESAHRGHCDVQVMPQAERDKCWERVPPLGRADMHWQPEKRGCPLLSGRPAGKESFQTWICSVRSEECVPGPTYFWVSEKFNAINISTPLNSRFS